MVKEKCIVEVDEKGKIAALSGICKVGDLREHFDEIKRTLGIKEKTKRKPSAYNLYLKECIPKKSGPITERFKGCVEEYKKSKGG